MKTETTPRKSPGRPGNVCGMTLQDLQFLHRSRSADSPEAFLAGGAGAASGSRVDGLRSLVVELRRAFTKDTLYWALTDAWGRQWTLPAPMDKSDWPRFAEAWELDDLRWDLKAKPAGDGFPHSYPRVVLGDTFKFYAGLRTRQEGTFITWGWSRLPNVTMGHGKWSLLTVGDAKWSSFAPKIAHLDVGLPGEESIASKKALEAFATIGCEYTRAKVFDEHWVPHFHAPGGEVASVEGLQ